MKKFLFSLILLFVSYLGYSQKGLSYQAVILDPSKIEIPGQDITGQPLVNGDVWLKFSIYNGSTMQFEEVHKTKTDNYGLVNLLIGSVSSGSFNSLVWDGSQKSLQVFVSFNQGGSYTKISDQKLNYNPYTFYAETAGKLSGVLPVANGGTGATTAADARANLGLDQVNNTSDAAKPVSTATRAALDLKANASDVTAGLALKANASDMSTSLAAKADTGTIKTFVVTQVAAATIADADANIKGKIKIAGDLSGTADVPTVPGLALKANTSDVVAALNLKANSVDITNALALKANGANVSASLNLKENTANKSLNVSTDGSSDIKYPSVKAVKDYVDARVQSGGGSATITDADANTKGIIRLTGDLGGTATAPTVPGLALKANAADLVTLTSSVNSNTASITANTNNIATLNANLATNTATMNAISSNFATLNADVVSNTSITTSNTTAITGEVARATAAELALTTNVASNTASTSANTAAITAEVSRATAAELLLSNNITAQTSTIILKANASDVSNALALKANAADLATLTSYVNTNTASITANANNIVTLNTNLASNTASITTNAADITTLNTNVASNTASVTSNATAITAEVSRATAAELVLTNNVAANTSSITSSITAINSKAPIASPTFTGTPSAPTATAGTSTTQLATTEFVTGAIATATIAASNITGTLPISAGGTGLASTPSNGQIDIGNGTGFTRATLIAGTGVTITNGVGSITINAAARSWTDQPAVSANQTTFNLSNTPPSTIKIWMFINGVRINNNAYSFSGATVTYVPANNGGYAITASDRVQFDYTY